MKKEFLYRRDFIECVLVTLIVDASASAWNFSIITKACAASLLVALLSFLFLWEQCKSRSRLKYTDTQSLKLGPFLTIVLFVQKPWFSLQSILVENWLFINKRYFKLPSTVSSTYRGLSVTFSQLSSVNRSLKMNSTT